MSTDASIAPRTVVGGVRDRVALPEGVLAARRVARPLDGADQEAHLRGGRAVLLDQPRRRASAASRWRARRCRGRSRHPEPRATPPRRRRRGPRRASAGAAARGGAPGWRGRTGCRAAPSAPAAGSPRSSPSRPRRRSGSRRRRRCWPGPSEDGRAGRGRGAARVIRVARAGSGRRERRGHSEAVGRLERASTRCPRRAPRATRAAARS